MDISVSPSLNVQARCVSNGKVTTSILSDNNNTLNLNRAIQGTRGHFTDSTSCVLMRSKGTKTSLHVNSHASCFLRCNYVHVLG